MHTHTHTHTHTSLSLSLPLPPSSTPRTSPLTPFTSLPNEICSQRTFFSGVHISPLCAMHTTRPHPPPPPAVPSRGVTQSCSSMIASARATLLPAAKHAEPFSCSAQYICIDIGSRVGTGHMVPYSLLHTKRGLCISFTVSVAPSLHTKPRLRTHHPPMRTYTAKQWAVKNQCLPHPPLSPLPRRIGMPP